MNTLYLMQGVPGSGKSTMARMIAAWANHQDDLVVTILSTDDHRVEECGHYVHDVTRNRWHHQMTQRECIRAMQDNYTTIIIDNTNITQEHAQPYLEFAKTYGYTVQVVRVDPGLVTAYKQNAERPPGRRVPEEVIKSMYERMERIVP